MKSISKDDSFLTIKEISKKTNLNPTTLYTILHFDRLNYETIGGRIVVKESIFNDWQKANIKTTGKEVNKK